MVEFYKRDNCRLCQSENLELVLKLNKSPLCDEYLKTIKIQKFYDLNLCYCLDCKFVQIDTIINPEVIYKNYIYVTSSSSGLVNHFTKYAKDVVKSIKLNQDDLVVDIGSNEGVLLKAFQNNGCKVLGVEPSVKAASIANGNNIETLCDFFNEQKAIEIKNNYGCAKTITINNLFANIDELYEFTKALELLLHKDGVVVIESSYLIDMINNMVFDFIYHEHLSYFSIHPLVKFFSQFNMKLIKLERIPTKGGSMRYYWAKNNSKYIEDKSVKELMKKEKDYNINLQLFQQYNTRIEKQKELLLNFLESNKDKQISGFGASATSTTLITHYSLDKYIEYLVDENIDKVDTFSPGYHIPVYSVDKLLEFNEKPKVVIILAWRYASDIIERNENFIKNGGKFIIPLPEFKIIEG